MSVPARLGIVTLAVADVARSCAFYERLGWERWQGPTYVRTAVGELHRTEEDDDGVMVLRTGPTADLDLTGPLACEERPGDDW